MVKGKRDETGKQLERLIAMLESALANTGAAIEAPSRRLRDRDTGRTREHDVLIIWDHGHHQIYTAIECRDRSRPVSVPAVEGFADKCDATGVHHRVMVSASGFQQTARIKAEKRAITCMDIENVDGFDWLAIDAAFVTYHRNCIRMNLKIMFDGDHSPDILSAVYDTNGRQMTDQEIMNRILQSIKFSNDPDDDVGRPISFHMNVLTDAWTAKDLSGKVWPISHMLVDADFIVEKRIAPLQGKRYRGGGKDYAFATADARLGNQAGKFIVMRNEDNTTTVSWLPDNHGATQTMRRVL